MEITSTTWLGFNKGHSFVSSSFPQWHFKEFGFPEKQTHSRCYIRKATLTVLQMYNDWSTLKILHCEGATCHLYMMLNKVRNKRGWFAVCWCGNITLAMGRTNNTVGGSWAFFPFIPNIDCLNDALGCELLLLKKHLTRSDIWILWMKQVVLLATAIFSSPHTSLATFLSPISPRQLVITGSSLFSRKTNPTVNHWND